MPLGSGGGVHSVGVHFVLFPAGFARNERPRWRPVELDDRHLRSHGKIGDCKRSTVQKKGIILYGQASALFLKYS